MLRFSRLFPRKRPAARVPSDVTILFQFLLRNWSALLKNDPIDSLLAAGLFLGKSLEKHEAEKEFSKLQKVIRKQEAKLIALESIQKKSFSDQRKIRELKTKIRKLETQKDSLSKPPRN